MSTLQGNTPIRLVKPLRPLAQPRYPDNDISVHELTQWVRSMRAGGLSERTVNDRHEVLERLCQTMGACPTEVNADQIEDWFVGHPEWSQATRATYMAAVRAFMRWAVVRQLRDDDPTMLLAKVRHPSGAPRPITTPQLRALLDAPCRKKTRAYVLLGAFQGLRSHEIAKIRGDDFDLDGGWLYVNGKGGKAARLPLHPEVRKLARTMPARGFWFPSRGASGHVTPTALSSVVSKHMDRCGVPGTLHQLRHWYATQLVRDGVNVRVVQQLMRHESLATTARYAAVAEDQLHAAMDGLSA